MREVIRTPCVNFVGGGAPNKGINPTRLSPLVSAARRAFRLVSIDKYHAATAARVMPSPFSEVPGCMRGEVPGCMRGEVPLPDPPATILPPKQPSATSRRASQPLVDLGAPLRFVLTQPSPALPVTRPSLPLLPKSCYNLEDNQQSPSQHRGLTLTDRRGGDTTSINTHLLQCGSDPARFTHR